MNKLPELYQRYREMAACYYHCIACNNLQDAFEILDRMIITEKDIRIRNQAKRKILLQNRLNKEI